MAGRSIGELIRRQRVAQRRSQLDLAVDAGVSSRHLGFVERGRARPSRELVRLLADRLDVPIRDHNEWLLAAGFAPAYPETPLHDSRLETFATSLQQVLDAHHPYPGVVIDHTWTVRLTNAAAVALAEGVPEHARGTPTNVFRICLHPGGLARHTTNFDAWSAYLLRELDHAVTTTGDHQLVELADEVETWPNIPSRHRWHERHPDLTNDQPVITWDLRRGGRDLSFFTTIATFGGPINVTISELAIELFYPADEATRSHLRRPA